MRKIFSLLLIAAFVLQSCQKDTKDKLPEETDQGTISSENPAQMSAAIKVWHGQRVSGTMPLPNSSQPEIDPTTNPEIKAFAGRFAIIKPEVLNGTVAGYFVGIPGAGQYFKVDFTKPRDISGRLGPKQPEKKAGAGIAGRLLDIQDGTADSSIVIVLPSNIQVPDTICVTYYPYDSNGNIGAGVTTCIIIASLGTDPANAWLQNTWKITSSWEVSNGQISNFDTVIFNKWLPTTQIGYGCFNFGSGDQLSSTYAGGPPVLINDSIIHYKNELRFATNGAMDISVIEDTKWVDLTASTCSQYQYLPIDSYNESYTGGWAYNSTTQKLLLVMEFTILGIPEPMAFEYTFIKIDNNHCILINREDPTVDLYFRFER